MLIRFPQRHLRCINHNNNKNQKLAKYKQGYRDTHRKSQGLWGAVADGAEGLGAHVAAAIPDRPRQVEVGDHQSLRCEIRRVVGHCDGFADQD